MSIVRVEEIRRTFCNHRGLDVKKWEKKKKKKAMFCFILIQH